MGTYKCIVQELQIIHIFKQNCILQTKISKFVKTGSIITHKKEKEQRTETAKEKSIHKREKYY